MGGRHPRIVSTKWSDMTGVDSGSRDKDRCALAPRRSERQWVGVSAPHGASEASASQPMDSTGPTRRYCAVGDRRAGGVPEEGGALVFSVDGAGVPHEEPLVGTFACDAVE